jgi:hypothetical protein
MTPNGSLANDSRALRARSNVQHLESVVEVVETDGRLAVTVTIGGTDDVPVAVELAFRHGGHLEGVEPVASANVLATPSRTDTMRRSSPATTNSEPSSSRTQPDTGLPCT